MMQIIRLLELWSRYRRVHVLRKGWTVVQNHGVQHRGHLSGFILHEELTSLQKSNLNISIVFRLL